MALAVEGNIFHLNGVTRPCTSVFRHIIHCENKREEIVITVHNASAHENNITRLFNKFTDFGDRYCT